MVVVFRRVVEEGVAVAVRQTGDMEAHAEIAGVERGEDAREDQDEQ